MNKTTPDTSYKALWITIAVLGILAITGIGIYALYVKKVTNPHNVCDNIFDVMTSKFDWFAEDYATAMVANGRNDKVTAAMNGGSSSSSTNDLSGIISSFTTN